MHKCIYISCFFLASLYIYMVALKHEHTLRDIKIQIIVHDHFSISAGLHAGGLTTFPLAGLTTWDLVEFTPSDTWISWIV